MLDQCGPMTVPTATADAKVLFLIMITLVMDFPKAFLKSAKDFPVDF
jgi:hypothetical protein